MLQKIRQLMKNQQGFTLIELMVVVIILGILAAIAIPRYMNKKQDAIDARKAADIKVLQNAVDMYYFDNGEYPEANTAANPPETDFHPLVAEKYLQDMPSDPIKGDSKYYIIDDDGKVTYGDATEPVESPELPEEGGS